MFSFESKAPPKADLKFMPPITSNAGGSFPRNTVFVISIEVVNSGNAASQPCSVLFEQRYHDDTQLISNIATDMMPALGLGATTLASAQIVISDFNTVFLHAYLVVNGQQVDSAVSGGVRGQAVSQDIRGALLFGFSRSHTNGPLSCASNG